RQNEMSLINEMGDMLQGCPTPEEAYVVMAHWAEQLFAGYGGAVCVMSASRNQVEPVAVWGNPALGEVLFAPDECWALRSGRVHAVTDPRSRLICRHITEPIAGGSLCVPMMAQGEALGLLHLEGISGSPFDIGRAPAAGAAGAGTESSADSVRQLAVTVAEHLAL